jgi:hypothetical protein
MERTSHCASLPRTPVLAARTPLLLGLEGHRISLRAKEKEKATGRRSRTLQDTPQSRPTLQDCGAPRLDYMSRVVGASGSGRMLPIGMILCTSFPVLDMGMAMIRPAAVAETSANDDISQDLGANHSRANYRDCRTRNRANPINQGCRSRTRACCNRGPQSRKLLSFSLLRGLLLSAWA